ncbi:MAG: AAA family ATPase [Desulfobacterales bacterium]|jgi:exodeoxyribonuclease V alpha subunit|nr:AAA family ATPase [Desulfobacterales bacterium]
MEIKLTEQQLTAVKMVQDNSISILTGGPGTGKSTTIKEVLNWANSRRLSVLQMAPTGKAAKRMQEVTSEYASTIHRALGCQFDVDGFSFAYNKYSQFPADLIIIDELSMVPNDLMASVMEAIDPRKTKLLLVGDKGQLPSVGAGAVLRDLMASSVVPHVELTMIHRNSGLIVESCHKIAAGQQYDPCKELKPEDGLNLRHIEVSTPERIQEVIRNIVTERIAVRGLDPVWDVQVISPTNSRSALSCDAINDVLQGILNPLPAGCAQSADTIFRAKDKVIQTKNEGIESEDGEKVLIVNGDMGEVVAVDGKKITVKFFDPERIVKLPLKVNNLLLAYCCTCHRMQGSEAPVVIIPVHKSFGFFVNRSWIYTAISRAKLFCITVGQFQAIREAIGRDDSLRRKTMLKEKLIEETLILNQKAA